MSPSNSLHSKEKNRQSVQHFENDSLPSSVTAPTGPRHAEPSALTRWRHLLREPMAEFLGTMVLILFGNGVVAQVILGGDPAVAGDKGGYANINIAWGIGTALGVWVSAGISGGHLNPAVTLVLAVFRGFAWRKVPVFIMSQILGAFTGAALVYANYYHAINIFEGGVGVRTLKTAGIFSTYSLDYVNRANAFFDEFLGTFILLFVVLALGDRVKNTNYVDGLAPIVLFLLITGIGMAFGMQTGYAINPARDFGPRLFTLCAGYGRQVFNFNNQYWIWCPILGPIIGGMCAAVVYDTFLFSDVVSPISRRLTSADEHSAEENSPAELPV